jgi:hypothetical protein
MIVYGTRLSPFVRKRWPKFGGYIASLLARPAFARVTDPKPVA